MKEEHKKEICILAGVEYKKIDGESLVSRILNISSPWPIWSILSKLIETSDILMHRFSYDAHGWETHKYARDAAEKHIKTIKKIHVDNLETEITLEILMKAVFKINREEKENFIEIFDNQLRVYTNKHRTILRFEDYKDETEAITEALIYVITEGE